MEKKRESAGDDDRAVIKDKQAVLEELRPKAMDLFKQIDTDGNGVIDRCAGEAEAAQLLRQQQNCAAPWSAEFNTSPA